MATVATPAAELEDPDVLADDDAARLLAGAPWRRLVVVGDSVARGLGDDSPGYRRLTWAQRLASALAAARPGLEFVNLARPELTAAEIRASQLDLALALRPDLVAYVGGGNDLLVEDVDLDALAATIDATIAPLAASGATVVTYSLMNLPAAFPVLEQLDLRLRALNALVAEVGARHDSVHVDAHSLPACADPALYSADLKHGTMRAQAIVASVTVRRLAERIGAAR